MSSREIEIENTNFIGVKRKIVHDPERRKLRTVNISLVTALSATKNRVGLYDILIDDDDATWIRTELTT